MFKMCISGLQQVSIGRTRVYTNPRHRHSCTGSGHNGQGTLPPPTRTTSGRCSTGRGKQLRSASKCLPSPGQPLPRPHTPAAARCRTHRTRGQRRSGSGGGRPAPRSASGPRTCHARTGAARPVHSARPRGAEQPSPAPGGSPGRRSSGPRPRHLLPGPRVTSLTYRSLRCKMTALRPGPVEPSGKPIMDPRAARGSGPLPPPPSGTSRAPRSP